MYIPHHFKLTDTNKIQNIIRANSFGTLVLQVDNRPWGVHIPFELFWENEDTPYLMGHVSRANAIWKGFDSDQQALAIFTGPHAFVSASWYSSEEKTVSTWNYQAVHVYGNIQEISGEKLVEHLHRLMSHYESSVNSSLLLSDVSPSKVQHLMRGIAGFKLTVNEVYAAEKMSQNRDSNSRQQIIAHLSAMDPISQQVSEIMKEADDCVSR